MRTGISLGIQEAICLKSGSLDVFILLLASLLLGYTWVCVSLKSIEEVLMPRSFDIFPLELVELITVCDYVKYKRRFVAV